MIKHCKIHGDTEYATISNTNKTYCKKCKVEQTHKRREQLKHQCYEYLGNKCYNCGKHFDLYDIHHINPETKSYSICSMLNRCVSFNKIKLELDKCILLCGNCHAEIHQKINENNASQYYDNIRKKNLRDI